MEKDLYISLIYKELDGSITSSEKLQLEEWELDPTYAEIKSQIVSVWNLAEGIDQPVKVDLDNDYALLQKKLNLGTKVVTMPKRSRNWLSIAAGVAILVAAIFGAQRFSQTSSELVSHTAISSNQYFMLEDGSEVYLQKGSTISYNQPMDSDRRLINLDGEAVFHVAHDKDWPLDVKTDHETITVLGTKFHVIENDLSSSIQLMEGKIAIKDISGKTITNLTKGQTLDRNHQTGSDKIQNELDVNRFSWQSKDLKFQNMRLADVAKVLSGHYGKLIDFGDERTKECRLSGSFKDKSLDQIMATIAEIHGIDIITEGDRIIWKGGACD